MPDPEPLADGQKLLDVEGDSVRDADALMVCVTVDVELKHSVAVGLIVDEIDGLLEDDIDVLTVAVAEADKHNDEVGESVREADALMVCVTVDVELKHSVAVGLIVVEIDGLLEDDIESLTDAVTEADKQSDAVADTEDVVDVHLLTVGEGEPERVADADID